MARLQLWFMAAYHLKNQILDFLSSLVLGKTEKSFLGLNNERDYLRMRGKKLKRIIVLYNDPQK